MIYLLPLTGGQASVLIFPTAGEHKQRSFLRLNFPFLHFKLGFSALIDRIQIKNAGDKPVPQAGIGAIHVPAVFFRLVPVFHQREGFPLDGRNSLKDRIFLAVLGISILEPLIYLGEQRPAVFRRQDQAGASARNMAGAGWTRGVDNLTLRHGIAGLENPDQTTTGVTAQNVRLNFNKI